MEFYLSLMLIAFVTTIVGAFLAVVTQQAYTDHEEEVAMAEHLGSQKAALDAARRDARRARMHK